MLTRGYKTIVIMVVVTLLAVSAWGATRQAYSFEPPRARLLQAYHDAKIKPIFSHRTRESVMLKASEPIEREVVKLVSKVDELSQRHSVSTLRTGNHPGVTTCTITTTADSGAGSLRQCLSDVGQDATIDFDPQLFSLDTPTTITVLSPLPWITSDGLTIDGRNAGVVLNGSGLSEGGGLVINAAERVTIQGLQILNFPWDAIALINGASHALIGGETPSARNLLSGNGSAGVWLQNSGTANNRVLGNYLGTDATGMAIQPNAFGIVIKSGAQNNMIGGTTTEARNIISGNSEVGVYLQDSGTSGNQVLGNYIGTDVTGMTALGNGEGVTMAFEAQNNMIGGTTAEARNLISGNTLAGVWLQNLGTSGNQVLGNYIGTDATGTITLGNNLAGVVVGFAAHNNIIGGEVEGAGNVISGNGGPGILLQFSGTNNNQVVGNYIGTDATGTAALGNTDGILIGFGVQNNMIGGTTTESRNIISGNLAAGIRLQNLTTSANQVLGNYIGTDVQGTSPLGNPLGIVVLDGSQNNIIGGTTAESRNLISGNTQAGIQLQGAQTSGNQVLGNYIGTDATGTTSLGNSDGVMIAFGAQNNMIGHNTVGGRNVISGNWDSGIHLEREASNNQVLGNYIGTDVTGMTQLANNYGITIKTMAKNNIIGGTTSEARNIISGNITLGVLIQDSGTSGNQVLGNYIGTDVEGMRALSNLGGITIAFGAQNNIIGSTTIGRNIISGNTLGGVQIQDSGTNNNQVVGNYIGTDATGMASLGNNDGVLIVDGAQNNVIGGALGNLISGNTEGGVWLQNPETSGNQVEGNYIGTNAEGTAALGNRTGVVLLDRTQNNIIGGATAEARNIISGNNEAGIQFQHSGTNDNLVQGNYIGTQPNGTTPLSNLGGVVIMLGAQNNIIGGTGLARNIISGNSEVGIQIQDSGTNNNLVQGNYIGTQPNGTISLSNLHGVAIGLGAQNNIIGGAGLARNIISGNTSYGIVLVSQGTSGNQVLGNYIGTDVAGSNPLANGLSGLYLVDGATLNTVGISNTIAYNGEAGVLIDGETTIGNTITRNTIKGNGGLPIDFINVSTPLPPPIFINYSPNDNTLSGSACQNCRVELFANPSSEPAGTRFLGEIIADAEGTFNATMAIPPDWPYLSGTVTNSEGTTSKLQVGFCTTPSCPTTPTIKLYLPTVLR